MTEDFCSLAFALLKAMFSFLAASTASALGLAKATLLLRVDSAVHQFDMPW